MGCCFSSGRGDETYPNSEIRLTYNSGKIVGFLVTSAIQEFFGFGESIYTIPKRCSSFRWRKRAGKNTTFPSDSVLFYTETHSSTGRSFPNFNGYVNDGRSSINSSIAVERVRQPTDSHSYGNQNSAASRITAKPDLSSSARQPRQPAPYSYTYDKENAAASKIKSKPDLPSSRRQPAPNSYSYVKENTVASKIIAKPALSSSTRQPAPYSYSYAKENAAASKITAEDDILSNIIFQSTPPLHRFQFENSFPATNSDRRDSSSSSEISSSTQCLVSENNFSSNLKPDWEIYELLAKRGEINMHSAKNIACLFENENTLPFICRYRRDLFSANITPDKMRSLKNAYTDIVNLRHQAQEIISKLEKEIFVNDAARAQILNAKTDKELELLYGIHRPVEKIILFKDLEIHATRLLVGDTPPLNPHRIIDRKNDSINTLAKVRKGLCYLISDKFSKDSGILTKLNRLLDTHEIILKCTKFSEVDTKESNEEFVNNATFKSSHGNHNNECNYDRYYTFSSEVKQLKPHQVFAINRGERRKFLSVNVIVPDNLKKQIKDYTYTKFMKDGLKYPLRFQIFKKSFEMCYRDKLLPYVCKEVRADLTASANLAGIKSFSSNLKQLLLKPPLRGERILGIDPGFRNGCKLAVISETADVLETGVIYPHRQNKKNNCWTTLKRMLDKHRCKIIALGNGTACRETETWLTELFERGILDSNEIHYMIVSEQGASAYSCTEVAQKEFPNLDITIISAVSIARRLNDPLSEFVKIEPRYLGVGMYQHDIDENMLENSLNEVVSECVSFVGVDINTASLSILRYIAGLDEKKAEDIIQYRKRHGPFRSRKELTKVESIDERTFSQCAGFVRIEPKTFGGKIADVLDCTWVHPESYTVAKSIIAERKLVMEDFGSSEFISKIQEFLNYTSIETLASRFNTPKERMELILNALQRELLEDYRPNFDRKLFKKGIKRFEDLFIGEIVTGEVRNVVDFGAFIDIGVGNDILLPSRKMNKIKLKVGDSVIGTVIEIDTERNRAQLRLDERI